MKTIKWETIKGHAVAAKCLSKDAVVQCRFSHSEEFSHFFLALLEAVNERKNPTDVLEDWMQKAQKIIENWDIRCARTLIKLCGLTKYDRPFFCEYDEKGDWVLVFGN